MMMPSLYARANHRRWLWASHVSVEGDEILAAIAPLFRNSFRVVPSPEYFLYERYVYGLENDSLVQKLPPQIAVLDPPLFVFWLCPPSYI